MILLTSRFNATVLDTIIYNKHRKSLDYYNCAFAHVVMVLYNYYSIDCVMNKVILMGVLVAHYL